MFWLCRQTCFLWCFHSKASALQSSALELPQFLHCVSSGMLTKANVGCPSVDLAQDERIQSLKRKIAVAPADGSKILRKSWSGPESEHRNLSAWSPLTHAHTYKSLTFYFRNAQNAMHTFPPVYPWEEEEPYTVCQGIRVWKNLSWAQRAHTQARTGAFQEGPGRLCNQTPRLI